MGTREQILVAAATIMREQGYARATTKEIARAAGYSEATLYKHFQDKTEIFLKVIGEQLPGLGDVIGELTLDGGSRSVLANLTRLARTAVDFYTESFPIAMSLFSSMEVLATHRERLAANGAGPRHPLDGMVRYLDAERRQGRITADVDPEAAASLLLGACFQRAFLVNFEGTAPTEDEIEGFAAALARTLLDGVRTA